MSTVAGPLSSSTRHHLAHSMKSMARRCRASRCTSLAFCSQVMSAVLDRPQCHDAFCIADIILQYLLEGDETLNRLASRLGLLDFCFTSAQPFLGKSAPGKGLGLGKSQFSTFLQTDLSTERYDTLGTLSLGDGPHQGSMKFVVHQCSLQHQKTRKNGVTQGQFSVHHKALL